MMGLSKSSTGGNIHRKNHGKSEQSSYKIAIAGNPNVGKSTIFNALTGMNQHTGNWPGKTVSFAEGKCLIGENTCTLIDIPGTYSLRSHSPEEEIAKEVLCGDIDAIVVVCDATCLERNLLLALQILELSKPTLICINLLDEARRKGIEIDRELLSSHLNVPIVGAVARKKGGLEELKQKLAQMLAASQQPIEKQPANRINTDSDARPAEYYVKKATSICQASVRITKEKSGDRDRLLDRVFTGKRTAYPIMIALLLLVFWLTIAGANYPSELLSSILFKLGDLLGEALLYIGCPTAIQSVIIDGAYKTLAWIVSVMLPPMAIFFPLFTVLEDIGYLPRVAYNLDNPFKKCNSCGKQALTMCMGFGCNAAGVVGCRIIDSPREQLIAILTNALVPCNGRFPLLISIITMFFIGSAAGPGASLASATLLTLLITLSILATLGISKLLSSTVLRGLPSAFTLELPPYRSPQVGKIIVRSVFDRTAFVLGRAVISAIPAGILIWLMANLHVSNQSLLDICAGFLDPFARIMGLDGVILIAFILGLPANEIVMPIIIMAYMSTSSLTDYTSLWELKDLLVANGWTHVTAICSLLFSLFHWPCATTLMTIKKESGSLKWTIAAAIIPTLLGITLCILANFAMNAF